MLKLNNTIAEALDAADYNGAALAILAHPRSVVLSRQSVQRLFDFGVNGEVPESVDIAMIRIFGDLMCAEMEALQ
jgi:hypothetical protein